MKKIIIILALMPFLGMSQQSEQLDINNINARINFIDGAFQSIGTSSPSFETPKGSGKNVIYAQGLWIAGQDINGQLKLAAQGYGQGQDFKGSCNNSFNRAWKVDKDSIDYHLANYTNGGYVAPLQISSWPAHGDTSCGDPLMLAPFVDQNQNGIYEPMSGDYPRIKCDQAIWWYMRDDTLHTETGGDQLGIELRCMAYACDCGQDSALQNTVFIDYEITNMGTQTIFDTYVGNWVDFDLGCAFDDYIGSNVEQGVFFAYNGDNLDEDCTGSFGYGSTTPAIGAMIFGPKQDADGIDNPGPTPGNGYYMDYSTASANDGVCYKGQGHHFGDGTIDNERLGLRKFGSYDITGDPTTPAHYYNILQGKDASGANWQYDNTGLDAHMVYPDSSDSEFWNTGGIPVNSWTEETNSNPVGDRRGLGSTGPFTFVPGQVETITMAYIYGMDYAATNNKSSIEVVLERSEYISAFIEQGLSCGQPVGIQELQSQKQFNVHPNPTDGICQITFELLPESVQLFNQMGQLVSTYYPNELEAKFDLSEFESGIYYLKIQTTTGSSSSAKVIKL